MLWSAGYNMLLNWSVKLGFLDLKCLAVAGWKANNLFVVLLQDGNIGARFSSHDEFDFMRDELGNSG